MSAFVLLVDADNSSLELMSAVLARDGFEIYATADGAQALDHIHSRNPDLVICGGTVGSMSGAELCHQIKVHNPQTRVVLLGELIDSPGSNAAPDGILPLPFRYATLKKILAPWGLITGPGIGPSAVSFAVPTNDSFKLELPAPPPVPGNIGPGSLIDSATPNDTVESVSLPPLPVPIPLPSAPVDDLPMAELPELMLENLALAGSNEYPDQAKSTQPNVSESPGSGTASLPLSGNFRQMPLPRLLYQLYVSTFSGALQVTNATASRTIFLWGGFPVRVDSKQLSESLGRVLLDHGRITAAQYAQSLEMVQTKGCRHGEALIELGAIRVIDLLDALQEQTEIKVVSTFAWRDATFHIDSQIDFARDSVLSEVHPLRAVWRGVHEHYDLESLLSYFVSLEQKYALATDLFPIHFDTLGPFLRDINIAHVLDGQTTFGQALRIDPRTLQMAQALYVLLVTDMIQPREAPGPAVSLPTNSPPTQSAPILDSDIARLVNEIAGEYVRVKQSDLLDVLRVDANATAEEIDMAFANISGSLHLESPPRGLPEESLRRGREIREILVRARSVVRNPALRDGYLREQEQARVKSQPVADVAGGSESHPVLPASLDLANNRKQTINLAAQRAYSEGRALMQTEQYAEALKKFQQAVTSQTDEPAYRVALGQAIWRAAEDKGEATRMRVVTCLQQALQLDPGHPEANLEMARLLATTGNKKRAREYVQRVLQRSPESSDARRIMEMLG